MVKLTADVIPGQNKPLDRPETLGPIRAWSYSALKVFEECPYRSYIAKVKYIPEPAGPAAERGSVIHQEAEDFVAAKLESLPMSLIKFQSQFEKLRELFAEAKVELEGEWGFDLDWNPVAWVGPTTWARIKLDALVHEDETSARVIDYKTGKKFGNEIPHSQQGLLYAIGAFQRYPHLQYAQTEFWYLDKGETTIKSYTRNQAMQFLPSWHKRGIIMTTATDFEPKPSKYNCRWCSYKNGDEPACYWGVS